MGHYWAILCFCNSMGFSIAQKVHRSSPRNPHGEAGSTADLRRRGWEDVRGSGGGAKLEGGEARVVTAEWRRSQMRAKVSEGRCHGESLPPAARMTKDKERDRACGRVKKA